MIESQGSSEAEPAREEIEQEGGETTVIGWPTR